MPDSNDAIIKLWLETNFAEATKQGGDALDHLREQVKTMGPDVEQALNQMEKATQATTTATDEQTQATQREAVAFDAATESALENIRAQERMREALEETATATSSLGTQLESLGGDMSSDEATGAGGKGFAGLAATMMKAERVGLAIGTGHGLARMGPMLESITSALGMGGGVGMAAGGLLFALEGIIPKVEQFFATWEKGADKISEVNQALAAFRNASASGQESRKKRRLGRIEAKIRALEDKEDDQGFLAEDDKLDLQKLREASKLGRDEIELEENEVKQQAASARHQEALDDQAAEDEIEANDPEQQMMERRHAARDARNAQVDAQNKASRTAKQQETARRRYNAQVGSYMGSLDQDNARDESARRRYNAQVGRYETEADTAQRHAEAAAARDEKGMERYLAKYQHDMAKDAREAPMLEAEAGARQMLGPMAGNFSDSQIKGIAHDALNRLPFTGGDGAAAIQQAINAAFEHGRRLQQKDLQRLRVSSESYLQ